MFKFFLLTITLFPIVTLHAQFQDNVWLFGYNYDPADDLSECFRFDFGDSLVITEYQQPMELGSSSAVISDSSGQLLLYSNSCYIANSDGATVPNSEGLNPGLMYDLFCSHGYSYNLPNNMLILPDPGNDSLIHIFHIPSIKSPDDFVYLSGMLHSTVDLAANNEAGETFLKNQTVFQDTMSIDGLHAVRHANGRDWWIVACKKFSNLYYLTLLSPQGLTVYQQQIGSPSLLDASSQVVFSPDGRKLARFDAKNGLRLYDFDRCTGELSNAILIPMPDSANTQSAAGCAWSADSHYLYAQESHLVYQFDLLASDLAALQTVAAYWDPAARCPFQVSFGFMELGPDGRIYCRPRSGQRCMHRMNHPERGGTASEMQLSYYSFNYPYFNLSHFPNFRLGPVDGSACDTLGLDNHPLAGWRYDHTSGLGVDFTSVSWYEPTAWLWDFGDPAAGSGNFSSEHNPAHTFSGPGKYNVCLTVSNQYGSNTKCKDVWLTTVGSTEPQAEAGITLYPNPTTGIVNWTGTTGSITLRVFNTLGTLLLEQKTENNYLNISALPDGFYTLQLWSPDQKVLVNRKLILEKH